MLNEGTVVMATLGTTEEGVERKQFGKLAANEFYRVSGIVRGNAGEVKKVKLAGVAEYWPASLFVEVEASVLQTLAEKVKEIDGMALANGVKSPVARSVRVCLEEPV